MGGIRYFPEWVAELLGIYTQGVGIGVWVEM
jgi:hypothetical protein